MRTFNRGRVRTSFVLSMRRRSELPQTIPCGPVKSGYAPLEEKRKALEKRIECLGPAAKASKAYKTARSLLSSRYVRSSLAARAELLDAAEFVTRVLEMMPPM